MLIKDINLKKLLILFIQCFFAFLKINSINEEWTKYSLNPVVGNSETGTLFDPFVIKEDNKYKMYVSLRSTGVIAITTSKDGIKWSELTTVLNKGNLKSWESVVNRGSLLI